MSSRNRIPPLLEPYLQLPPESSQLLLTGVLDASPHWLVTRLLRSVYGDLKSTTTQNSEEEKGEETEGNDNVSVVLVSWMRDYEFWKSEVRRGAGIDLARLAQQHRFAFVDGLTHLFTPTPSSSPSPVSQASPVPQSPSRNLPIRGPTPSRTPLSSRSPIPQPQPTQTQQPSQPGTTTLKDKILQTVYTTITNTITTLTNSNPGTKILLILDSPTLLLSTSATPNAVALSNLILSLRSKVHSTTLTLETDIPFLDAAAAAAAAASSSQKPPLDVENAAFIVSQAHVSDWVVGLRPLDTGKARDVSGVVRVSRGGAWDQRLDFVEDGGDDEKGLGKEVEALYFVQSDAGVRVFERGEASVG